MCFDYITRVVLMNIPRKILVLMITFALFFTGNVSAVLITFDESGVSGSSFVSSDGSILGEWVWETGSTTHGHHHANTDVFGKYEDGHGQSFQGIRFSSIDLSPLTLDSFDMRGAWLVGLLNDGAGTLYSAGIEGSGGWTTQAVGLTSANHIYIYANGKIGKGDLDNVVFNTVPGPATLVLLGIALLMGFAFQEIKNNAVK